ncbi:WD40 repeat-like protein [Setomelanomma holmii]|uniref:WD40 repeat-like protein n=1 Tax=Setomelanomma holmii TaxID=210430 RepID=A0A9P4LPT0_9PLEO|nr:WD40 repeat-like protein [Setomelanomma holmii]
MADVIRLLRCSVTGDFGLPEVFASKKTIPPYAILSHTWEDGQEVTFQDLMDSTGKDKTGYHKIRLCTQQAERDDLQYCWIDTCCIDKSNPAELQKAINSMFRWYKNAKQCYVYLQDVSTMKRKVSDRDIKYIWETAFRQSRWFRRGWTLQELLAPTSVEFFSQEWKSLGDKQSLVQHIHEATGIPNTALQGAPMVRFSEKERFSWIQSRETKIEEDKAYALLGIFDVEMPLCYKEGYACAFKRLQEEISKLNTCLRDLRSTDPRSDKKRIEDTKGGLLLDSYRWILDNPEFQEWRDSERTRLLWMKGDPGKGKTMLLCGIINELSKSVAETALLSYFFCQATDSRINNATAVLRGLIYMLVSRQPSLVVHVRKKYDHTGNTLFEDANAWVALSEIFTDMSQDPSLKGTYLVVDALDECVTDLPKLLDLIVQMSSTSSRVKWIMSSRNWPDIEERLERAGDKVRLNLELNADSVSAAVRSYIQHKVSRLAQDKKYTDQTKDVVLRYLYTNANDTFLWAALVCQNLNQMSRFNIVKKLEAFPPGLDSLYDRMIQRINNSDDAELCRRILAIIAVGYRPITLLELTSLVEELDDMADEIDSVQEVVNLCGSLLTIRDGIVYFVHQSAKDFLLKEAFDVIFPAGSKVIHYGVFSRSLRAMSKTLRRDIYELDALGCLIEQIELPKPDPLAALRYSCIYWIDHLCAWSLDSTLYDASVLGSGGIVDSFLRKNFLYWLEALSLCMSISKGVVSMTSLEAFTEERAFASSTMEVVQDARRFIMYHKSAIESSPLQAYGALLFSPTGSVIRGLFKDEEPKGIVIKPVMQDKWSGCLSTLESHSDNVNLAVFSHDSTQLASASRDSTVKIWDAYSGKCVQTLKGHKKAVNSVAFSYDATLLASGSEDGTVKIWDAHSGECVQTLQGDSVRVVSVAFAHNSTRLAWAGRNRTIKIWDVHIDECVQTLEGHGDNVINSVAFSHDSTQLASAGNDRGVNIWDIHSGECVHTLGGHGDTFINSVAFSHDSTWIVSASWDKTVKIWDAYSGECAQTLKGHNKAVSSVAFSHNSTRLTSASWDSTVKIWDTHSGKCLQTLEGHGDSVGSVAFSYDSTRVVSASYDKTVKIWDACSDEYMQKTFQSHSSSIDSVAFSHDATLLASASDDSTVKIWDTHTGECVQTLKGHSVECLAGVMGYSAPINSVAFSHDSTWLASASYDKTVKIWDTYSGECVQTLEGHGDSIDSVAFSHDSTWLASASRNGTIKIWDAHSGKCLRSLTLHDRWHSGMNSSEYSLAFSHDSTRLASASASRDGTIKIWDTHSGECVQTLKGHNDCVNLVAFSRDSTWLASAGSTLKIWDAHSGECLQTLNIGKTLHSISFDINNSHLKTDAGVIDINDLLRSSINPVDTGPQSVRCHGLALSADKVWITYNSENVVRLPSEYRPSSSAILGNTIGIGVGSGRVWICEVHPSIV